ncbi:hypothetical protein EST38_g14625 [Candolleomyces aberdarensis]|uniref:Uncharacterized protein n=1 Tax=Candolleomyces aberdarensis TaxID=2316362 RepID=A0A4Q2CWT0_9AGAR|nr:hypothetical protein EST38_g14625 [Candolleomyces aberdarensis]
MILLFLALHYFYGLASTAPTGGAVATTLESADGVVDVYRTNYRSTAQIVTSCLSTVLLCTWFTIHPDVYGYKSTWKQRVRVKVELFVWTLLVPELVMMWACNQWFGARAICKEIGTPELIST